MSTIAKGEITLSPVNDAYTVLITPASCTITADFDGSNPNLDNAKGTITVKRGTLEAPFKITGIAKSSDTIAVSYSSQQATTMPFAITQVGNTILNGYVDFNLKTDDGFNYTTQIRFSFSIVRESTMLDWIQDWEGSKTKIGGTYIMTPKLFVGKKEDIVAEVNGIPTWNKGALTGVYIGPDLLSSGASSVGIYGYLKDAEIFHINADGGYIGGWTFNAAGLQSSNGVVNILSEGTVFAQSPSSTTPYWGIYSDGHVVFANGNVKFQADGSAEYTGKITSTSGSIGGWSIMTHQLYNSRIIIDSVGGFIGINASTTQTFDSTSGDAIFPNNPDGGLKIWYSAANNFGLAGWSSGAKVFQLGSTNQIAGWTFNHQAIWIGALAPSLTQHSYTADANALTIATNGLRSHKWYLDADGTAAYVGGLVKFNTSNAEMFGWLMREGRFSTKHAALVSEESNAGLYVAVSDISEISGDSLKNVISNNGGIYLNSNDTTAVMAAYDHEGHLGFSLNTSGINQIGKWNFDHEVLYTGNRALNANGFTQNDGAIIIGIDGLISSKWKFLKTGAGAVASGNFNWDTEGNISLVGSSLKILDAENNVVSFFDSDGHISASLINVKSVECRDTSSDTLLSGINREGDGAFCIYYPSGAIMMRYGYDKAADGIESVVQHYMEDGTKDWVISPNGSIMAAQWTTANYWSIEDFDKRPDYYKATSTPIYTLTANGAGTIFYYSEPNTTKLFTGTLWALLCSPITDESGQTGAYRNKRVIKDGREISSSDVLMGYPSEDFNWELGE